MASDEATTTAVVYSGPPTAEQVAFEHDTPLLHHFGQRGVSQPIFQQADGFTSTGMATSQGRPHGLCRVVT